MYMLGRALTSYDVHSTQSSHGASQPEQISPQYMHSSHASTSGKLAQFYTTFPDDLHLSDAHPWHCLLSTVAQRSHVRVQLSTVMQRSSE